MYHVINMFTKTDWTENGPVTHYEFEFGFRGKEQYLDQTAGWKAEYKELSRRIRQYKLWRKPSMRPGDVYDVYGPLETMQAQARMMCAMRVQAKAEACRQMVEQRKAA